jgi:hypothetical protein
MGFKHALLAGLLPMSACAAGRKSDLPLKPNAKDWLTCSGQYDGQRHSTLSEHD